MTVTECGLAWEGNEFLLKGGVSVLRLCSKSDWNVSATEGESPVTGYNRKIVRADLFSSGLYWSGDCNFVFLEWSTEIVILPFLGVGLVGILV